MKKPSPRRADRSPERCRAGGGLLGGKDPAGRFLSVGELTNRSTSSLLAPTFQRLPPQPAKFFVLGLVLFHPFHGLVIPLVGFTLVAKLPVSHAQNEPVVAVAS